MEGVGVGSEGFVRRDGVGPGTLGGDGLFVGVGGGGGVMFLEVVVGAEQAEEGVLHAALVAVEEEEGVAGGVLVEGLGEEVAGGLAGGGGFEGEELAFGVGE